MALNFKGFGFAFNAKDNNTTKTVKKVSSSVNELGTSFDKVGKEKSSNFIHGLNLMSNAFQNLQLDKIKQQFSNLNNKMEKTSEIALGGSVTAGIKDTGMEISALTAKMKVEWDEVLKASGSSVSKAIGKVQGASVKFGMSYDDVTSAYTDLLGKTGDSKMADAALNTALTIKKAYGTDIGVVMGSLQSSWQQTGAKVDEFVGSLIGMGKASGTTKEIMGSMEKTVSSFGNQLQAFDPSITGDKVVAFTKDFYSLVGGLAKAMPGMGFGGAEEAINGYMTKFMKLKEFATKFNAKSYLTDTEALSDKPTQFLISEIIKTLNIGSDEVFSRMQDSRAYLDTLGATYQKLGGSATQAGQDFFRSVDSTMGAGMATLLNNFDKISLGINVVAVQGKNGIGNVGKVSKQVNSGFDTMNAALEQSKKNLEAYIASLGGAAYAKAMNFHMKSIERLKGYLSGIKKKGGLGSDLLDIYAAFKMGGVSAGFFAILDKIEKKWPETAAFLKNTIGPMISVISDLGIGFSELAVAGVGAFLVLKPIIKGVGGLFVDAFRTAKGAVGELGKKLLGVNEQLATHTTLLGKLMHPLKTIKDGGGIWNMIFHPFNFAMKGLGDMNGIISGPMVKVFMLAGKIVSAVGKAVMTVIVLTLKWSVGVTGLATVFAIFGQRAVGVAKTLASFADIFAGLTAITKNLGPTFQRFYKIVQPTGNILSFFGDSMISWAEKLSVKLIQLFNWVRVSKLGFVLRMIFTGMGAQVSNVVASLSGFIAKIKSIPVIGSVITGISSGFAKLFTVVKSTKAFQGILKVFGKLGTFMQTGYSMPWMQKVATWGGRIAKLDMIANLFRGGKSATGAISGVESVLLRIEKTVGAIGKTGSKMGKLFSFLGRMVTWGFVIYNVYKKIGEIMDVWGEKSTLSLGDKITASIKIAGDIVWNTINDLFFGIPKMLADAFSGKSLAAGFKNLGSSMNAALKDLGPVFTNIGSKFGEWMGSGIDWVKTLFAGFDFAAIMAEFSAMDWSNAFEGGKGGGFFGTLLDSIGKIFGPAMSKIGDVLSNVNWGSFILNLLSGLWDGIGGLWNMLTSFLIKGLRWLDENVFGGSLSGFINGFEMIFKAIGNLWDTLKPTIMIVIAALAPAFLILLGIAKGLFSVIGGIFSFAAGIISGAVNIISGAIDIIIGFFELFTGDPTRFLKGFSKIFSGITNIVTGAIDFFVGLFNGVVKFFGGIGDVITLAIVSPFKAALKFIADLFSGESMGKAISLEKISGVFARLIDGFVDMLPDGVKKFWGIKNTSEDLGLNTKGKKDLYYASIASDKNAGQKMFWENIKGLAAITGTKGAGAKGDFTNEQAMGIMSRANLADPKQLAVFLGNINKGNFGLSDKAGMAKGLMDKTGTAVYKEALRNFKTIPEFQYDDAFKATGVGEVKLQVSKEETKKKEEPKKKQDSVSLVKGEAESTSSAAADNNAVMKQLTDAIKSLTSNGIAVNITIDKNGLLNALQNRDNNKEKKMGREGTTK